jgi:hypothetical protein
MLGLWTVVLPLLALQLSRAMFKLQPVTDPLTGAVTLPPFWRAMGTLLFKDVWQLQLSRASSSSGAMGMLAWDVFSGMWLLVFVLLCTHITYTVAV